MAAFREHVTFSSVLGVVYGGVLNHYLGVDVTQAVLAGALCGFAGMLPDLDSDSGKPIREMFNLLSALGAFLLLHRLRRLNLAFEDRLLAAIAFYIFLRFGVRMIFQRLTVHRGMFHSIPAMFIAGGLTYLATENLTPPTPWLLAVGVTLGFFSHLVLDEIYSVDLSGVIPKYKSSAGTALKFYSASWGASLFTWGILSLIAWQIVSQLGWIEHGPPTTAELWSNTKLLFPRAGIPD
ncbi:MAG TPA: metal-dependent hydrolase [Gemmatales bacterium]|nr:metal-dependent hydrolase [Gemmatales bacterium]HMP59532.1 metal-dependent hydrolase [Gemmatales bacterium]